MSSRIELHRRIAEREESAYAERVHEIAAVLAHHFKRANEPAKVVEYSRLAGKQAVERRAYREAEQYFREALTLLRARSDAIVPEDRELELRQSLAAILQITRGYSALETAEAVAAIGKFQRQNGKADGSPYQEADRNPAFAAAQGLNQSR